MAALRRTEEFQSVKTRGLVYQNPNGSFPPLGSVLAATSTTGACAPTVDLSVNSMKVGAYVTVGGNISAASVTANSHVSVNGGLIEYNTLTGLTLNNVPMQSLLSFSPAGRMFPQQTVDSNLIGVSEQYMHGVLAENGRIYCAPASASTGILIIDPLTNTRRYTSSIVAPRFTNGAYAYNNTIYFMGQTYSPTYYNVIYKFDTQNENISIIEVPSSLFSGLINVQYYTGAVLGPNRVMYAIPAVGFNPFKLNHKLLYFDTTTETSQTLTLTRLQDVGWAGGVLAPNGCIYGVPSTGSDVMKINTTTNNVSYIALADSSANRWYGGVLAQNGKIYCIPSSETKILVIDPTTDTVAYISIGAYATALGWAGGVLGMDGKIYCIPRNSSNVLVIDPTSGTVSAIPTGDSGDNKWFGGVLGPQGSIYGVPYNASGALVIRPGLPTLPPWMLGPEFNKL